MSNTLGLLLSTYIQVSSVHPIATLLKYGNNTHANSQLYIHELNVIQTRLGDPSVRLKQHTGNVHQLNMMLDRNPGNISLEPSLQNGEPVSITLGKPSEFQYLKYFQNRSQAPTWPLCKCAHLFGPASHLFIRKSCSYGITACRLQALRNEKNPRGIHLRCIAEERRVLLVFKTTSGQILVTQTN